MKENTGPKKNWRIVSKGRFFNLFGIALIGLLTLAACAGPNADPSNDVQSGAGTTALPADLEITVYQGAETLGGQAVHLSEMLAQGKPVVLNMWAGLCPPCRLEMPDFQAVYDAYQDEILLVGLDVGPFTALGTREDGQQLLQALGITYPAGTTFDATVVQDYQLTGMPSTYFIKPNGEIARKWTGLLTEKKLSELVQELLAASEGS